MGCNQQWHELYKWCNMTCYSIANFKRIIRYCALIMLLYMNRDAHPSPSNTDDACPL